MTHLQAPAQGGEILSHSPQTRAGWWLLAECPRAPHLQAQAKSSVHPDDGDEQVLATSGRTGRCRDCSANNERVKGVAGRPMQVCVCLVKGRGWQEQLSLRLRSSCLTVCHTGNSGAACTLAARLWSAGNMASILHCALLQVSQGNGPLQPVGWDTLAPVSAAVEPELVASSPKAAISELRVPKGRGGHNLANFRCTAA